MKRIEQIFFVMLGGLLLLACTAGSAYAQDINPNKPPIQPGERRFPPITPGSILEGPKVGELQSNVISGRVRWRKEYGLPSIDGGLTPDKATNCTAIRVQASIQEAVPGTFGETVYVGAIELQNEPTEEDGYYICGYSITNHNNNLPRNQVITVSGFIGPYAGPDLNRALISGRWYGGTEPLPPPGYQRALVGGRGVTLTESQPRATVNFEIVYNPIPQGPR